MADEPLELRLVVVTRLTFDHCVAVLTLTTVVDSLMLTTVVDHCVAVSMLTTVLPCRCAVAAGALPDKKSCTS
jgi:hypothetical protein